MKKTNFAKTKRCMAVLLALVLMCTMLSNALITAMATTDIDALLATVDADAVTIADAATINEIGALYDALDTDTQATYTDTVDALRSALATEVKKGYTAISTSNFQTGYYHWINSVGHVVTNDVLRLTFSRSSNTNPAVNAEMTSSYKFDGFEVMFNNFVINSDTAAYAGINMLFAKSANVDFSKSTVSGLLLSLDVKNGKLIVNFKDYTSGTLTYKYAEIAESDLLKADSLQYNAFAIAINATADANNPYAVTVTLADGNSVTGNIPADCFNADAVLSSEKAVVQFTVGALNSTGAIMSGATNNSYDVVGYRDNTEAVSNIAWLNEKIAALDVAAVKESDIAAINEIEAVYNSLIDMNKAQVVNAEKISTLKQAVLPLVKEGYITYGAASEFTTDHWSSSTPPVLSYADGMIGLCFNDTALSVGKRIGPDNAVEFDGIEYKFNNLVSHSTTTTVAGFGIAFTKDTSFVSSGTFSSGLLLFLDAKAGNLLLNLNGKTKYLTLIENSDVLKLANLQYNAFTLGIAATNDENNPYCVTIRSANGQSVSANIPAEYFDAATVMSDGKSYVTFTRGRYDSTGATTGSTYTTFDVVGYRNSKDSQANIAWVNEQLALLDPATITEANAKVINKISALYENMIPMEKAQITEAAKIPTLSAGLLALVKDGYAGFSNYTTDHWPTTGWFTDGTDYDSFRLSRDTSLSPTQRIGPKTLYLFDGLELKFNNLRQTKEGTATGFGILFSTTAGKEFGASATGLLLYIDAKTGSLILNLNGKSKYTELISGSDVLKLSSLEYNAFTVSVSATGVETAPYKVTIKTADGNSVSANIPAEYFDASAVLIGKKTYITFTGGRYDSTGGITGSVYCNFDVIGYSGEGNTADKIAFITEQLAALDVQTVTESDSAIINKIDVLYEGLSAENKAPFTDKLNALKASVLAISKQGYTSFAESDFTGYHYKNTFTHSNTNGVERIGYNSIANLNPARTAWLNKMLKLDGLELKLTRFYQGDEGDHSGFGLVLTKDSNADGIDITSAQKSGLLAYINMQEGSLTVQRKDGTTVTSTVLVADNNLLKLANLQYETFTIAFNSTADTANPYKITIKTADGDVVTANIPAEYFNAETVLLDGNTYVAFTPGLYYVSPATSFTTAAVDDTFDIIGYRDCTGADENVAWVNEQLAALDPAAVTEANIKAITKMAALYEKMIPAEKALIVGADEIPLLQAAVAPLVKENYVNFSDYTDDYWSGTGWFTLGEVARFKLEQTSLNPQMRIGPKTALDFDGLELKFNNLRKTGNGTSTGFGIQFTAERGTEYTPSAKGLLLYIDAEEGNLILNLDGTSKYTELVTNSDVLKLSSLEYNAFTVIVNKTDDAQNPYSITVKTADGKSVSANIPAEYFSASSVLVGDKTYVAITRGRYDSTGGADGSVYCTFDFVGYNNEALLNYINELIANIPAQVTVADGNAINRAVAYYNTLSDAQKQKVVGLDKLLAAADTYQNAFGASVGDEWTIIEGNNQLVSKIEDMNGENWWGAGFATALGGKNGVRVNWTNMGIDHRISIKKAVNMDGLKLLFNRWVQTGGKAEFAIYFASNAANEYDRYGANELAIVFNANDGTVKAATAWNSVGGADPVYVDVIKSDLLKYENIGGGSFTLTFDKQSDGYSLTVTVGNESVSGTIPTAVFETVKASLANPGNCYIAVSAWNKVTQSLDAVGYITYPDVDPDEVTAWIDALPETVTEDDAEALDKIYEKYIIANDQQLSEITNLDVFLAKMKAYRKELSFQSDTFSVEYVGLKDAAKWWPSGFDCVGIENDGGIRITWNGMGRDVRQGYGKKVPLHGLKLQFGALHKTNESAADPKLALYIGDAVGSPWTYNNTVTTRPLAIVLDTEEGALYAQPSGSLLVKDDKLKYENLEYKVFYIEINRNDDQLWQVEVMGDDFTVCGVMSMDDFSAGERFTNPDACFVTLSVWEKAYATIEWTGVGQSTKHVPVTEMIDELRVVDKDSKAALDAAEAAYEALPEYVKNRVSNYDILEAAAEAFFWLDDSDPVPFVIQQIEKLGKIDITKKPLIDEIEAWYNTLTKAQKARVTNSQVLFNAINEYYRLYAAHMEWDSCVYAPSVNDVLYSQELIDSWWNGTVKMDHGESGGTLFTFTDAKRDHRNAYGKYNLDGLNIQLSNLTKTGEGAGTGVLAITVGPNYTDYGKGLSITAKRAMVFVLDTNEGTLTLYPAGNQYFTIPVELFSSDALKYENITGKNFSLIFEEIGSDNYTVRFMISDGTLLSSEIPARVICPLKYFGALHKCYVQVGAWQDGTNQTVELVSIYDCENVSAASQVQPVIDYIKTLPDAATLDAEPQIRKAVSKYNSLMKKGLKEQVSNYGKLAKLRYDLSVLWDQNDIDPYEYEEPEEDDEYVELGLYAGGAKGFRAVPVVAETEKSSICTSLATCFTALLAGMLLNSKKETFSGEKEERN